MPAAVSSGGGLLVSPVSFAGPGDSGPPHPVGIRSAPGSEIGESDASDEAGRFEAELGGALDDEVLEEGRVDVDAVGVSAGE